MSTPRRNLLAAFAIIMIAAIPLAAVLGSYMGAHFDRKWYQAATVLAFFVGAAGLIGTLIIVEKLAPAATASTKRRAVLAGLLYLLLVPGVWFLAARFSERTSVSVDNFSDRDLVLELDGRHWLNLGKGTTAQERLRHGRYQVTVRAAGQPVDTVEIAVDRDGPFVFNCLGAQEYERGIVCYSHFDVPAPAPTQSRERWIRANVDYLFARPPTRLEARTGKATEAASRTYLIRK